MCLRWVDTCLVGVLSAQISDFGRERQRERSIRIVGGWTYMPFNALRASAFTRATCSMAICTFCLNNSGEFGSTRVDPEVVVVVLVAPVVS